MKRQSVAAETFGVGCLADFLYAQDIAFEMCPAAVSYTHLDVYKRQGVQLGADSTDIFLLVMNQRGLDRLLSDKFALGVDVNVAAGPVGRDANADTCLLYTSRCV